MKTALTNVPVLLLLVSLVVAFSIYQDCGSEHWHWFQRSGTMVLLVGAVLGYRSIVRMGVAGVGGVSTTVRTGKVLGVDDSQSVRKIRVSYDEKTREHLGQAARDQLSGYAGAILVILGTAICGYGDLLGLLLK